MACRRCAREVDRQTQRSSSYATKHDKEKRRMARVKSDDALQQRAALDQPSFYASDLDHVHDVYAQLRREDSVFWHELGQFWIVSKYEDQRYVLRTPELFASGYGQEVADNYPPKTAASSLPEWAQHELAAGGLDRAETRSLITRARMSVGFSRDARFVATMDPPMHQHYRGLHAASFSPRLVRGDAPLA